MAHRREPRPDRARKGEQGFTLIELLVVITIISILAAVVSVSVGGFITTANEKTRQSQFAAVQAAIDTYVSTNLDASGDLKQAKYPIAAANTFLAATSRAVNLGATTVLVGEVSPLNWYGSDGRVCGDGNKCTATPVVGSYIYVDLYSGVSTCTPTDLACNSFISKGAVKSFGIPGTDAGGVRCLYKSGTSGGVGPAGTASATSEITTGVTNVRANKGELYVCRDTDPKAT